MKKMLKRLCTGFLALATVVTALPTTPVHAESKQYWTESKERVGIVEKVMNDGSIGSTFNEGHLTVEGEDAYCIDINTDFKNGYKTRADASTRMSADQISDVALSIEYVKQYTDSHNGISKNHAYLLRQLVVWQRLSVHLGWQCDNDTVKLDGLTKGTKYQLKGWQMLKEENAELVIDGKRVENDYTFIADDEAMKVEIAYTFNASELGGKNLVTFEELYDLSNPDEPVKVAEHKDIEDDGQTVLITERIIKIHTTATDKDGNKELEAGKEVTIIDTVTLEGLEVGTQYKLVGWQMLKEENAELLINGKRAESDYTFTADSETMKVEVAFTFDATSLDGKQLVTFEELYDLSNPDEPKKVTEHKDIEDEGQTITFKEKPEVPEEPEKPETPQTPNTPHKTDSPKTGDNTNLYGLLALLLTSGAGLAGIFFYKRRQTKKS